MVIHFQLTLAPPSPHLCPSSSFRVGGGSSQQDMFLDTWIQNLKWTLTAWLWVTALLFQKWGWGAVLYRHKRWILLPVDGHCSHASTVMWNGQLPASNWNYFPSLLTKAYWNLCEWKLHCYKYNLECVLIYFSKHFICQHQYCIITSHTLLVACWDVTSHCTADCNTPVYHDTSLDIR